MKNLNKITLINIYIANRVLKNQFEKGMAEDLQAIEKMFENNNFSGLDDIYQKYFIPHTLNLITRTSELKPTDCMEFE
ncbi:MAG: hypothetical protein JSW33_04105 [bacterium]|nr:MAG: hypothetical protein JSW33_04105 [bacterium]